MGLSDATLAGVKNPEGAAFMADVMRRVEVGNPTDLSKAMGPPWTARDQQRKLYKWASGEAAPNFAGTLALLRIAGLLREEELPEGAAGLARQGQYASQGDIGEAVAAVVKEMRSGFRKMDRRLQGLEQQRTAGEGQSRPRAGRG